jgi:hypothetical protein
VFFQEQRNNGRRTMAEEQWLKKQGFWVVFLEIRSFCLIAKSQKLSLLYTPSPEQGALPSNVPSPPPDPLQNNNILLLTGT